MGRRGQVDGARQTKRKVLSASMNGLTSPPIALAGAVSTNWKKSTVLPASSTGAKNRAWNCATLVPFAVSSTPRTYITWLPKRTSRSPFSVASGEARFSRAHVAFAADSKSVARATLSWLRMALTQKPSTSLGSRTTATAPGASSSTQPSGTVNTNAGMPLMSLPGWTTARAAISAVDGSVSMKFDDSSLESTAKSEPGMLPVPADRGVSTMTSDKREGE